MESAVRIATHANFAWVCCNLAFLISVLGGCKIHKAHCIATIAMFINFVTKINAGTTLCFSNVASMIISAVTFNIIPNSEVLASATLLLSINGTLDTTNLECSPVA